MITKTSKKVSTTTRSREQLDDYVKDDPGREVVIFTETQGSVQAHGAFLEGVCAGDENLREKVEALLRAHDRLGNFWDEPPTEALAE